ncbi:MAG: trehalase family glycosidase, partial [Ignavibacteria bacterium]|nr:trehalase family glycosidase [Ignavibacteria bacterium]
AAAIDRSEFIVDEGYRFIWYDPSNGINFETDTGGNLCLAFKLNNEVRFKLDQFYSEPVITTSYSDLVKYYFYPYEGLRVEIFFLVYSSRIAVEDIKIINERSDDIEISIYPFFYHSNDTITDVYFLNEEDGFTFRHKERPDGWTLGHDVPFQEDLNDTYLIDSPANSFGAYSDLGDIPPPGFRENNNVDNYCVEWGKVFHSDDSLCMHTPPEAQQVIYHNGSNSEILTEEAPKWGNSDPNIPGNGFQSCELGNFQNPPIAEGDSFQVVFTCIATIEQGNGYGIIPSLLSLEGVYLDIFLEPYSSPQIPENVDATFSQNNTVAVISWTYVPGILYSVYRRTAFTPGRYDLLADQINSGGYWDWTVNPDSLYGYVVIAENDSGEISEHSIEVGNVNDSRMFFSDAVNNALYNIIPTDEIKVAAVQKKLNIYANSSADLRIIRGVAEAESSVDSLVSACRNLKAVDLEQFVYDYEELYSKIPNLTFTDPDEEMMYWSAFSLIRQCMLPPEGECSYNYNVYSREPTWGWGHAGQVFHENLSMLSYAFMDPESAQNSQRVFSERMNTRPEWPQGYIPYRTGPYLNEVNFLAGEYSSSAPWFSFENLEIFKVSKDTSFLSEMYSKGEEFYNFWINERDDDGDGLCEWGGHAFWESVRDYNVIWDLLGGWSDPHSANKVEALDLNCELVMEAKSLSEIAAILGKEDESVLWQQRAQQRANLINSFMWDDQTKFYYHVMKGDHSFTYQNPNDLKRKEQIGLLPLWAGLANQEQANYLKQEIMNEFTFGRPYGIPLLAHNDPYGGYDAHSVYLEWDYFNFKGLLHYGYIDEANTLAQRLFDGVIQVLKDYHDFYESYYCDAKRPSDSWLHTYIWTGIVARMLIDLDNVSDVIRRDNQTPARFELYQNYPNPFNLSTTIKFSLVKQEKVTLKVFDVIGREVKVLLNEDKPAGESTIVFDAKNLVSGMYFYTIKSGDFMQTKKMILLK